MKIKALVSKLSKRERINLILAVILLLGVLIDRLVYQPIASRFEAFNQEIQAQEQKLRKNRGYLAARERILEEHKIYMGYLSRAGSDEEETSRLLSEVEGLARESDLFITNMKPQVVAPPDFEKQYSIEIEFKGEMAQLIKFLYGLHQSKYLLNNQQFRLTKDKSSSSIKGYLSITKTVLL